MLFVFGSGSGQRERLLSNLADTPFSLTWSTAQCIPEHLRGQTLQYLTAEHAYQSLKTADLASAQKMAQLSMLAFRAWPTSKKQSTEVNQPPLTLGVYDKLIYGYTLTQDMYEKKMAYWGARRCCGIVAQMASRLEPSLAARGLNLRMAPGWTYEPDFESQLQIWEQILVAKYEQNEAARRALVSTAGHTLVERARFKRSGSNYWNAFVQRDPDGVRLIGHNMMGRLLQFVRDKHFVL